MNAAMRIQVGIIVWLIALTVFLMAGGSISEKSMPLFDKVFSVLLIILNPQALGALIGKVVESMNHVPDPQGPEKLKGEQV